MSGKNSPLIRLWAKAERDGPGFHPLAYHGLDVAAVASRLLALDRSLCRRLATAAQLTEAEAQSWLPFLLALHDVGKAADGFQCLRPDLMRELQGSARAAPYPGEERHELLGWRMWIEILASELEQLAVLKTGVAHPGPLRYITEPWLQPIFCHHGRPRIPPSAPAPLDSLVPAEVLDQLRGYLEFCTERFGLSPWAFDATREDALVAAGKSASWLAAGIAIAADWIGSNTTWFPFTPEPMPLLDYWERCALPRAEVAIRAAGLLPSSVADFAGLGHLFPAIAERLTPLQAAVESIHLAEGPQLFVLEEITGGGKTEAALTLAHRLLAAGLADGIFFALPTMATANAMLVRLVGPHRRLFAPGAEPSLVLAHSRAKSFQWQPPASPRGQPDGAELAAEQLAPAWLADSRKKALLAQVGVGTIDQALLAALPVKHQSLRLLGLTRHVLVVDEVHACDPYVAKLLERLLELQAALGGSAIILSATLAHQQRSDLSRGFASGLAAGAPALVRREYPLITRVSSAPPLEIAVASPTALARRVQVHRLDTTEEADDLLCQTADSGGCAAWIRNTVDDAIEAWQRLSARLGPERVTLLHARFAVCDRAAIELDLVQRFGPQSDHVARTRRVVVATQVLEQSLDVDFDELVSDLAPIDRLIQRAGRLRRHARNEHGDRIDGKDRRGEARLRLLAPQATEGAPSDWFAAFLPRASWVYPDHDKLWLSARWLEERGGFRVPEDCREMIEAVFGEVPFLKIPPALEPRRDRAQGQDHAEAGLAAQFALRAREGYTATRGWLDEENTPTRLGEPTATFCLLRETDAGWAPWSEASWEQSEVSVRRSRLASTDPQLSAEHVEALRGAMPGGGRFVEPLLLTPHGAEWRAFGAGPAGERREIRYDPRNGLRWVVEGGGAD